MNHQNCTKLLCLLVCLLGLRFQGTAQVISFNTQLLAPTYTGNNGSNQISFVIENTNSYPAVLTSVSNYFASAGTGNFVLYATSTPSALSGYQGAPPAAPNWTPIYSVAGVVVGAGVQSNIFPILSYTLNPNTTYRFVIEGTGTTVSYSGTGTNLSPNTFSNTGINLDCGDFTIAGLPVGYGGAAVNVPRYFTGSVTLNLLSTPCSGAVAAGTAVAVPTNPCPGIPITLSLTGSSSGSGLTYSWQRRLLPGGSWGNINLFTATAIYYPPINSNNYEYRCLVTCTTNGSTQYSVASASVQVQPYTPNSPCYCTPTNTGGSCITNVTFGTLNNTTAGCTGVNNYNLYTSPIPNIIVGLATTFNVTCDANAITSVWIDYNHNTVFEPSEWYQPYINATTGPISITVPGSALTGPTRMRVRSRLPGNPNGSSDACIAMGSGETEDYFINIIPSGPYDPTVSSMLAPVGVNCLGATESLSASICNYGGTSINCLINPVYVTFTVTGPLGVTTYHDSIKTGTLNAFGAACQSVNATPVNMFAGGTYSINAYVTCPSLSNSFTGNDSLTSPIVLTNYRPNAGPDYHLCQYSSVPFGAGLGVNGCSVPLHDSVTITFNVTPTADNVGATAIGTSLVGANCQNAFAGDYGNAIMPTLPAGAYFTQNAKLTVSNLSSSFISECRFTLYGASAASATYAPCPTGYNTGAGNPLIGGQAIGNIANFTYNRDILATPAAGSPLSALFGGIPPGGTIHLGYFETWNDNQNTSDISPNASGTTVATLKVYYDYIPPSFAWYNFPTGGTSLYSLSPFNPLAVPNAVVNNSNTPGNYTFYAACLGLTDCRIPVHMIIDTTPVTIQDTLAYCEASPSSNYAIFDLTTMNNYVDGGILGDSVIYYFDDILVSPVTYPTMDTSSTNFVYSKVFYPATGCFSSDSLLLQVNPRPEFPSSPVSGFACAPSCIDVSSLINPFSTVPPGTDTLFYSNPACTTLFPNPHCIPSASTVYMVFVTNTAPACSDTAVANINVIPSTNQIANQDPLNYSIFGSVGCNVVSITDGASDTLRTSTDCKRVAAITDYVNGNALGGTSVCEDIDPGVPIYNSQPYVNRAYEITPTVNDSAYVCLYYLDDDFQQYNSQASISGYPYLPTAANPLTSTLAITQVENGPIGTIGSTATAIPNSAINISYDPSTTVWTVCFHVDSFSYFYCHTQNPFNIPLPVDLTFSAKREAAVSHVNWTTMTEKNNSHFVVERSQDGKTFHAISAPILSKATNGNSQVNINYDYVDATPNNGHNYYRLQQNDLDHHQSYSKIVDVYFGNETMVTLYPNPVNTELNIDINTPKATTADVKIIDAIGRTVRTVSIQLIAGDNHSLVNMEGLTDGVYMVHISNKKGLDYTQTITKK